MSQNLVSLSMSNEQLVAVDAALTQLEEQFKGLIALTAEKRRSATKMGAKSEVFCRQTLNILGQNPQLVPSSVDLTDARADLQTIDLLRPHFQRLRKLTERAVDTEFALGSDVMVTALQGYALLKVVGRSQGLEGLRKSVGERFSKVKSAVEVKAA